MYRFAKTCKDVCMYHANASMHVYMRAWVDGSIGAFLFWMFCPQGILDMIFNINI